MIDTIAFDADDTLWHTERYYRAVERDFLAMVAGYGAQPEQARSILQRVEIENLAYFGYGIRGFILTLIEVAAKVCGEQLRTADLHSLVDWGKAMTSHPIDLMDGVESALTGMAGRRLMVITKGDVLDQESKVLRSGLGGYFQSVEVVTDKTRAAYDHLLARHAVDPARFLMVGNSLRSDIAPVLELGGHAVHVPYALTWAHESEADLPADRSRFYEIASLRDLPGLLARIEG